MALRFIPQASTDGGVVVESDSHRSGMKASGSGPKTDASWVIEKWFARMMELAGMWYPM
jgi:hypothetical protein